MLNPIGFTTNSSFIPDNDLVLIDNWVLSTMALLFFSGLLLLQPLR